MPKSIFSQLFSHQEKEKKVLLSAHKKSQRIIEKAVKEASQIIVQANFFHKGLENVLKAKLEKAVEEASIAYQKELKNLITHSLIEFQKMIKNQFEKDQLLLHNETEVMKRLMEKEIETYKQQKKQAVDRDISQKVTEIVKEAFIEELPASFREKLVFKALDKAKKDGFFTSH